MRTGEPEIRVAKTYTAELSREEDITILVLWGLNLNTQEIATKLKRPEWQIANRLWRIRTKGAGNVIRRSPD